MATRFETEFQGTPTGMLEDLFGESVTYTPYGRSSLALTGRWTPGEMLEQAYEDGEQQVERGVLRMNPADVPNPSARDSAVIRGVTWQVETVGRTSPTLELAMVRRKQARVEGKSSRIER